MTARWRLRGNEVEAKDGPTATGGTAFANAAEAPRRSPPWNGRARMR